MADKQISDLTAATGMTDGSLFVIEQSGTAKNINWGKLKNYISPGIAPLYSNSSTYAVGDYVIYNDQLYRCTTAITTAEAWTAAHWAAAVLGDDVGDLKSQLSYKADNKYGGITGSTYIPLSSPKDLHSKMSSELNCRAVLYFSKQKYT